MSDLEAIIAAANDTQDRTAFGALADFLDEYEIPADTSLLRGTDYPLAAAPLPDGSVHVCRRWTVAEILDHNPAYRNPSQLRRFLDRPVFRQNFNTTFHGEPVHGPGGVFVILSKTPGALQDVDYLVMRVWADGRLVHPGVAAICDSLESAQALARQVSVQVRDVACA